MAQASTWRVMVNFTANNMTGGAFNSLLSSINQAHTGTQNLTNAMNALKVAAGGALVAFGKTGVEVFTKSAEAAGNLQQQLVLMKQTLGSMGDSGGMRALANQRANLTTGANPVLLSELEVAHIQRQLLGAGISTGSITKRYGNRSLGDMTTYVAELEQARGLGDPTKTAENLAGFIKGYGIKSGAATTNALDTFQKAQSITSHFSSEYLRYGEQYGGLTARTLGISPSDFVTFLAVQAQQNIGASTAGTNLNNMLLYGLNPASMTNAQLSARQASLARTGMLGKADLSVAHQMSLATTAGFNAANFKTDPSALSPKQREAYASYMLEASSTSLFAQYLGKYGGVEGTTKYLKRLYEADTREQHKYGKDDNWRTSRFVQDIEAQFGVRGSRIVEAFAPIDAQGHIQDAMKTRDAIRNQSPAEKLIQSLRGTLPNQEKFAQARMLDILVNLGGVDKTTGIAIKGGPLDTLQRIMTAINNLLVSIEKFTQAHPDAAAHIGTLIGMLGVAAVVGGTALAGMGAVGLAGAALGVGGRAVAGAAFKGTGGFLANTIGKLFAHPSAADAHWMFGSRFTNAGGRFAKNVGAFGGEAVNGFKTPNLYRGAAMMYHDIFGPITKSFSKMLPFIEIGSKTLVFFGAKLLGVVGWVLLAIDAFRFFRDHPKDIANWVAAVLVFFRDKLMPGIKDGFIAIGMWILGYLKDILEMMKPTNWAKIPGWFAEVQNQVQHKMDNENKYLDNQRKNHAKKSGDVAPKHDKGKNGPLALENHYHIHGADPKTVAMEVQKLQTRDLKRAMRQSTGGLGVPGVSYASTGLA